MTDLADLSLTAAVEALQDGLTSEALTQACLDRLERTQHLNAFITTDSSGALTAAQASDQRRKNGKTHGPLDGIPIGLKDLLVTQGMKTTAGSKILAPFVPPYQGTMAARLHAAGAVIIGKTNLDEFAMGSSNEHSAFGPTLNPWDPACIPGGSSGGSAVAVAAGQCLGALGTDTGGSIRQPAAMTGVLGLKPTYGRVSRYGVIAFASSLDQVGPFGRSAKDIAHQLQVIAGFDSMDSTSVDRPVPDYHAHLDRGIKDLTIGVPEEYFGEGVHEDVEGAVHAGIQALKDAGATVTPVSLPHTKYALSTYYVICTAEASANLARYDGVRYGQRATEGQLHRMYAKSRHEGFGEEVKRRIVLGTYVLSAGYYDAYYGRAQKVRTLIRQDFEQAFSKVDLLATPTSPVVAFKLGARLDDPLTMYKADVMTLAVNLAGLPALSMPAGFSTEGLPIGMQLIGPWFEEARLLQAAHTFETVTDHHVQRPKLS